METINNANIQWINSGPNMHRGSNTGNFSTILTTSSDVDDELLSNVIPYQITVDNKNSLYGAISSFVFVFWYRKHNNELFTFYKVLLKGLVLTVVFFILHTTSRKTKVLMINVLSYYFLSNFRRERE